MTEPVNTPLKKLLQIPKAEILAIADHHGAYNIRIRVFGSVARAATTIACKTSWTRSQFLPKCETALGEVAIGLPLIPAVILEVRGC